MDNKKVLTYKATEENIIKILITAYKETNDLSWIVELFLCYEDNQKLLEDNGLDLDEVRTFMKIKKSKAVITKTELRLIKIPSERKETRKKLITALLENLNELEKY